MPIVSLATVRQCIVISVLASTVSCAANKAAVNKAVSFRLYNLTNAEVLQGTFDFRGTTQGLVSITLPSGDVLTGEYQTLRGGSTAWGSIYTSVLSQTGLVGSVSSGAVRVTPDEYAGTAIAAGSEGLLMECEYITNNSATDPHGQGACRDSNGVQFKLMF